MFYDEKHYIGQVVDIHAPSEAQVQFLQKSRGNNAFFRWPDIEDVADVNARFVFRSDIDVVPIGDARIWKVPLHQEI